MIYVNLAPPVKRCAACFVVKLKSEFYPCPQKKNGVRSYCRPCVLSQMKVRNATADGKRIVREYRLRGDYGITQERYDELFAKQDGCCAICGRHRSAQKRILSVDHDHATGAVRELLCARCNTGLGGADDDIGVLQAMIDYLKRHGK
jgi:Recombination endonuclease VII